VEPQARFLSEGGDYGCLARLVLGGAVCGDFERDRGSGHAEFELLW
jgi:hypothetical protein